MVAPAWSAAAVEMRCGLPEDDREAEGGLSTAPTPQASQQKRGNRSQPGLQVYEEFSRLTKS
jgi:hypothetical protein